MKRFALLFLVVGLAAPRTATAQFLGEITALYDPVAHDSRVFVALTTRQRSATLSGIDLNLGDSRSYRRGRSPASASKARISDPSPENH